MTHILPLKDIEKKIRQLTNFFQQETDEYVIQDDQNQPIAVVLPLESYASYQEYLRQREKDFTIFDTIDKKMSAYDPDFIDNQIEQAIADTAKP